MTFLLKNLKRGQGDRFNWKLNIDAIIKNLKHILEGINKKAFEKGRSVTGFPVLFIKGGNSNYITMEDTSLIKTIFSQADIKTIEGTGHWVHAEAGERLVNCIKGFILGEG